ncbi:MAG: acetylxylan esterase [Fimbriimonadales bacterium]|nr:acetylxylan esterase [Fimbriimonadales bacterium]
MRPRLLLAMLASGTVVAGALAQSLVVQPWPASGIAPAGSKVGWTVRLAEGALRQDVTLRLKLNGLEPFAAWSQRKLPGGAIAVETTLDRPGWLLLEAETKVGDRVVAGQGGMAFSPWRLKPCTQRPKDFDDFWQAKLRELAKVPMNPRLERADSGSEGVEYYRVQLDHFRGSKIHGQLAKPTKAGKLPALLIVQWAGVYPLQRDWVVSRAKMGFLTLNIMAHDLPFDRPKEFYDELSRGPLANYAAIGNDDRETSYFLRMYLSCYRAAEYLVRRPDWNGRTLVVTGGSQGGLQTIVTAALHPKVTAGLADVPAGCDQNGPLAGRAPGWPMWHWQTQGKDPQKVRRTAEYFDVVHFARRVRCPMLVGVGLIDTVCPPPGVFAMVNELRGAKETVVMPSAAHVGDHGPYWRRSEEWLRDLVRDRRPSVRPWGEEAGRGS